MKLNLNPTAAVVRWAKLFTATPELTQAAKGSTQDFNMALDAAGLSIPQMIACWYVCFGYDTASMFAADFGVTLFGMERSAAPRVFLVGQRVIYKIAKNEWYVGTVVKLTPTKVFIQYDDGFLSKTGTPKTDTDIFHYTGTRKEKKPLSDAEARLVKSTKEVPAVPPPAKKPAAKKPAVKAPVKPAVKAPVKPAKPATPVVTPPEQKRVPSVGYARAGQMALIKYSNGDKWKYVHDKSGQSIYVSKGDSTKLQAIPMRFILDARDATPEEINEYSVARTDAVKEKVLEVKVDADRMVAVKYSNSPYPVWEYCYRVDRFKGTFSVAGGGSKMRDLPMSLAVETREPTPTEKEAAAIRRARMTSRGEALRNRRANRFNF